jgi:hypothetical protein
VILGVPTAEPALTDGTQDSTCRAFLLGARRSQIAHQKSPMDGLTLDQQPTYNVLYPHPEKA